MTWRYCMTCSKRKLTTSFDDGVDACRLCARGVQRCSSCGEDKPATAEHFSSNGPGELHHRCRPCAVRRAVESKRAAREAYAERLARAGEEPEPAPVIDFPRRDWTLDDIGTRDCQVCGRRNREGQRFCSIPHREHNVLSLEEHALMRPRAGEGW